MQLHNSYILFVYNNQNTKAKVLKMIKKILISTLFLFSTSYAVDASTSTSNPLMTLTDINGTTYKIKGTQEGLDIEGLKGKVVFLEFFGHQCPPCLASIPHLINLKNKYKDKLAIVSIEVQGYDTKQLSAFAKEKGMNYTVISGNTASEVVDYIQQRAQWRGSIPFLVVLDPKGNVQFVQAGMLPESSLEKLIEDFLPKENTIKSPDANKSKTVDTNTTKH